MNQTKRKPLNLAQIGLATACVALTLGVFYDPLHLFLAACWAMLGPPHFNEPLDAYYRQKAEQSAALQKVARDPLVDKNAEMLKPPVKAPTPKLMPTQGHILRMGG